jgi:hypothetical protein
MEERIYNHSPHRNLDLLQMTSPKKPSQASKQSAPKRNKDGSLRKKMGPPKGCPAHPGGGAPKGHPPYPGCETGGRPKIYTEEFVDKEADLFEAWMKKKDSIFFKNFAISRGYHPEKLADFSRVTEKFNRVYRQAKAWQEGKLVQGGLTNKYNSGFCKFVMANTCGWKERSETTVSGDSANPLKFILEKADGATKDLVEEE